MDAPLAATYLELRRFSNPKSPSFALDASSWLARVQLVLVVHDRWMLAYSRGLWQGGVRSSWRTHAWQSIPTSLRRADQDSSSDLAFGLLTVAGATWLRQRSDSTRGMPTFDINSREYSTATLDSVFRLMIRDAHDNAGWQLIKPLTVTIPATRENHDALYSARGRAPWPALNRFKKQYAKHGVTI